MYSLGLSWDAFTQAVTDGVRARCPGAPGTPTDALSYLARDRQLVRGALESATAFADRCRTSFDDWTRAGSLEGTIREVQALYSPASVNALAVGGQNATRRTWCAITTTGGAASYLSTVANAWDWDGNATQWARAWLFLHVQTATWPSVTLGQPGLVLGAANWCIGIFVPKARVDDVLLVVRRWKSAGTIVQVVLSYNPTWPLPTGGPGPNYPAGDWGSWHVWDGAVSRPVRYANARYLSPVA